MSTGDISDIGEVFVSHCHHDREFADRIATALRDHGIPFWYSTRNIIGAQQWHDEIGIALGRCRWFLLILSPDAVASPWVKHELLYALNNAHYEKRIIPCVIADCDVNLPSWTLASFQIVDFRKDENAGFRNLMRILGMGFAKPSKPTAKHVKRSNKGRR